MTLKKSNIFLLLIFEVLSTPIIHSDYLCYTSSPSLFFMYSFQIFAVW